MSTSIDSYHLARSKQPQNINLESPYVSKQWLWVSDTNNGTYNTGGTSQVNFNLNINDKSTQW